MSDLHHTKWQRARELRNAPTDAERHLWRYLSRRQVGGAKFRRQVLIGPYIVDFACLEHRLVVELDGGQHAEPLQRVQDAQRTKWLESQGFRVMRFWNNQVLAETETVLEAIYGAMFGEGR